MNTVISIIVGILLLGVIIVFHEFGHFLMCKMYNVAVPQFFVGFGPKLCSFKKGETLFSIRLLPFGGACQMASIENDDVDPERTINNKKPLVKLCIYVAGPIFNFIMAFLVSLIVIGFVGYDSPSVTGVIENSPAYEAGLRPGDVITRYNDMDVHLGRELAVELRYNPIDGSPVEIAYERDGEEFSTVFTPTYNRVYRLGFQYMLDDSFATVINLDEDGAFYKAGVRKNDIITEINGEKIGTGNDLKGYFDRNPVDKNPISVTAERNGSEFSFNVLPIAIEDYDAGLYFNSNYRTEIDGLSVIGYSFYELRYNIVGTFKSIVMLFTGKLSSDEVGGPVRIVEALGETIEATEDEGTFIVVMNILNWIILLSANLGVMNLLPIPGLDGGKIVLALVEMVRRKRIPPEKEGIITLAGMILLVIVAVIVFFKDIVGLFT
ncbi:MAG: RIP metalloprotease RseP [Lachnospiraceae bacterium]|nr:RIP metalloprotease RseP [Lachnospiraceae bacterium]